MELGTDQPLHGAATRSLDEVEDAIDGLTDGAIEGLIAKADAISFGTGVEGADIFGDAVRGALEGNRLWPTDVPFDVFLIMTMKSVASNLRRKAGRTISVDMSVEGHSVQEAQQRFGSPEEEKMIAGLRCRALVDRVLELFKDDEQALALVMGRVDQLSVDEICELGSIERGAYGTVSKRVQRKLAEAIGSGAIQ